MAGVDDVSPVLMLGAVGGGGDPAGRVGNITWSALNTSILLDSNETEFEFLGNTSDQEFGHVPYLQRVETYLVPFLFAVIFIVGVIGK